MALLLNKIELNIFRPKSSIRFNHGTSLLSEMPRIHDSKVEYYDYIMMFNM